MKIKCLQSGETFNEKQATQHAKNKHRKTLKQATQDQLMQVLCDKCGQPAENPVENPDGTKTYFCTNQNCSIQGIPVQ